MDKSYGYPITNEREYIILLLLIYLINNTVIIPIKLILCIVFITHIYKLYRNYEINENIYDNDYEYNLLLLGGLLLLINNNSYSYIIFSIIFIITGIIYRKKSYEKYILERMNYQDILIIISSLIILSIYPNYRYKFIFIMEIINHGIILLE